ncbi:Homeobox domain containing protein [Ceratobasidium theobromae]|uniref:Homeobox domain containing protein n=1 Tax=Ceratobasidium theobromae TaxID=1582974 RepID=A0A5N5Q911_9AGAM|nr:Homeobox domain containing protein [Ceratobasidium theobromae]
MSETSFLEVAASVREVLRQNLPLTQPHIPPPSNNPPPIDQPAIQRRFIDFSQHVSSFKLPPAVASEVATLMAKQSHKYQEVVEQAHLRMLHEIYSSCDAVTATNLIPHARMARDAIYDRSVNRILEVANQLVGDLDLEGGSMSDADGLSDSESSSGDEDGDEDDDEDGGEGIEDEADDDENSPMKPGEEVPPLETKYLPIFEALHERGKVLTKPEKTYLVNLTGMTYRQITIWFQNRRRGELKEDLHARANSYALSIHSDQTSDLSDDELILEKKLSNIQPSDTTFNIRSWRLASAVAPPDMPTPTFPPSPTKVGFTDATAPQLDSDSDSDLTDSDDETSRSDVGLRGVPSLTTSSATFDSSSDHGPATVTSSSSRVHHGLSATPAIATEKDRLEPSLAFTRPVKPLPSARRISPPAPLQTTQQRAEPQTTPTFSFNFTNTAPAPTQSQFLAVSVPVPTQPPQFVTSNERGLTVEMETTPPRSTITLQPQPAPNSSGPPPAISPSSPVLPSGSPHSASSPSPSSPSPRPPVKPLPRRTGCAPRPRPPPRAGSVATAPMSSAPASTAPTSARSSVVLPPASNPSLAGTTLGALLRPNIPPPIIPPEMEERLTAMAGRMGVVNGNGQRRAGTTPGIPPHRGTSFSFSSSPLPGVVTSPGTNGSMTPVLSSVSGHDLNSKI